MANNGSYSNDRSSASADIDYATDPASGSFFNSDYKKHEDLKQMLDMNKDSMKLEAMKRIIGMVAKGRDASDLFPAVVKNVVSKNIEVKKLVYVYLVRYAEEQQDLALLSISTFQRALKDPNQLIRASALRVLSSIRVPVIVPIVMLAIKDSASDMSPYVRKTAAHAIPKLYCLDPDQKDELILVIEKLLSDRTTLVVGSAVMAFEEVCPERIDLIHRNYRKLCNLLVDVDEWGQVIIINMLSRYARTQFIDPNIDDAGIDSDDNKPFYDDEEEPKTKKHTVSLDPDHKLLLRNAKPLLQSRNASVVMSVAQLYHHLAPRSEVPVVAKSLIRLLRSHREVQSVVLHCIASIATVRKAMFEPFMKSFFVRTSDPTHIKLLKLEILTTLATESSISFILREFQTYISNPDKEFVAATIQAIGRCASNIKEVTDSCLSGLVSMLSNRDEAVVAESVVVIKKLLQSQPSRHKDIISQMSALLDSITVPQARASILWLLGEYSQLVPNIAPDVLRKMAKSFIQEEDIVKLQVLNLAVKLYLTNPAQTRLLCQYVFSLARYDQNYDIRDRSRFLRQFVLTENPLSQYAKQIFLATKPAPQLISKFQDQEELQLGSLSHYINTRAAGYHDLPQFPDVAPSSSERNVADTSTPPPATQDTDYPPQKQQKKKKSFYSESDSSPPDESEGSGESSEGEEDGEEESGDEEDSSDSDSESETESGSEENSQKKPKPKKEEKEAVESESESEDSSEEDSEEEDSSSDTPVAVTPVKKKHTTTPSSATKTVNKSATATAKSNLDLLLDFTEEAPTMTPLMTPSLGGFLTPLVATPTSQNAATAGIQVASAAYIPAKSIEVLNKVSGGGLGVSSRFTRAPHLFSPTMTSVQLTFTNHTTAPLTDIRVANKTVSAGMEVHDFAPVASLSPNCAAQGTLGVAWNDSTQPVTLELAWEQGGSARLTLKPHVGELLRPVTMPVTLFTSEQGKLRGMNEHSASVSWSRDSAALSERVLAAANVAPILTVEPNILRFAGQTLASKSLVLVTCQCLPDTNSVQLTVNCEKMVVGSMLLNEIKKYILNPDS
ncbi:AP-3 complex subunit beta-2 [Macrosteles quadrilineatus]|uniref:AP-3 complex subunit beta-2 n=1 Tax=Macrosteles quadrilineatus TaxID=74068 RepID=UPI0023E1A658|nr:AP-3 complex subunit beta-2 [Macrosteles quadrilineatus]